MFREKNIYGQDPRIIVRSRTTFYDPLKWKTPKRIFVCSWSDFYIEEADPWRPEAWQLIKATPGHVFMILTKRPERIPTLPDLENVWIGVSVESGDFLHRVDSLLLHDYPRSFVSLEPFIAPIDIQTYLPRLSWVIAGGESGSGARPMISAWARKIYIQCKSKGVPFFFKQMGGSRKIGGVWGGELLDGKKIQQIPKEMKQITG